MRAGLRVWRMCKGVLYAMNHATDGHPKCRHQRTYWRLDTDQSGRRGRCCVQLPGSQHRRCDEPYGLQFDRFRHVSSGSGVIVSITATMAYTSVDPVFAAAIPQLSATYITRFQ